MTIQIKTKKIIDKTSKTKINSTLKSQILDITLLIFNNYQFLKTWIELLIRIAQEMKLTRKYKSCL